MVDPMERLRERLRAAMTTGMAKAGEVECPTCRGSGTVIRTQRRWTQSDVAEVIGVPRTSVAHFLGGKQGFTMPATLRLLEWLDEQERPDGR